MRYKKINIFCGTVAQEGLVVQLRKAAGFDQPGNFGIVTGFTDDSTRPRVADENGQAVLQCQDATDCIDIVSQQSLLMAIVRAQ